MIVKVQKEDFDVRRVVDSLCQGCADIGAVVSFTGLVRDAADGDEITALELEHYPGMTEKSLLDIVEQAKQRWELQGVRIVHRVGKLKPTEQIVLVVVAAKHRGEAFAACEFVMDYLKTHAPFWKKEYTGQGAHWVDARESDDHAQRRWQQT